MKNATFISIFAAVILVGGGIYLYSQQSAPQIDPSANSGQDVMKKDEAMMEKDEQSDAMMVEEKYVPYSTEVFEGSTDKRRVLFFYASWCPTCIPADKNFQENSAQIPDDVLLIRVNYNDPETDAEEKALAEKYGVTYQHTFVEIDTSGNEVTKWNGGQIEELLTNVK